MPRTLPVIALALASALPASGALARPTASAPPSASAHRVADAPSSPMSHKLDQTRIARRGGHLSPKKRKALEKRVQQRIDTFVTVELATELELDQKTALKLLEAWKGHRQAVNTGRTQTKAAANALAEALERKASDAEIAPLTQALRATLRPTNEAADLADRTKGFLSVRQQAKLMLAYPQIHREVRKMMRRARKKGFKGGRNDAEGPTRGKRRAP